MPVIVCLVREPCLQRELQMPHTYLVIVKKKFEFIESPQTIVEISKNIANYASFGRCITKNIYQ